jgi:alanyl-tRNA synthetase
LVARIVGGSGGGRPTMAQAGGKDVTRLGEAIEQAPSLIAKK